jgi:HEAT repeat protein
VALNDASVSIEVRVQQAKNLAKAGLEPSVLQGLLLGLDVKSEVLRDAILASLVNLKAGPALVQQVSDTKAPLEARLLAMRGLRTLKPAESVPSLAGWLRDPEAKVRAAVAQLLCVYGGRENEAALIQALSDASSDVRYYSVTALATVGTANSKAALEQLKASEKDAVVQDALAQALRK